MPEDQARAWIKTSIALSPAQHAALRELSAQQGQASLNSLIRQAIDAWLKRKRR